MIAEIFKALLDTARRAKWAILLCALLNAGIAIGATAVPQAAGVLLYLAVFMPPVVLIAALLVGMLLAFINFHIFKSVMKANDLETEHARFFPFLRLSFTVGILILIGLKLWIIPGLFLAARLAVAVPLVLQKPNGAIEAIQESWNFTRGKTPPIAVVITAFWLPVLWPRLPIHAPPDLLSQAIAQAAGPDLLSLGVFSAIIAATNVALPVAILKAYSGKVTVQAA